MTVINKHDKQLLRERAGEIEKLRRTLRVIYTWATFGAGEALDPVHVGTLIEKTLRTAAAGGEEGK